MAVSRAQAFLIPSGTALNPDIKHLHIVCTNPCADNCVLLVPVSSWTNSLCDKSCVLVAGEHEFIKHQSWIMYRNARIAPCADIDAGILSGKFVKKEDCKPEILTKVCAGLLASAAAKPKIKAYLLKNSGFIFPDSRPFDGGRHGGEDSVRIAAGAEAE